MGFPDGTDIVDAVRRALPSLADEIDEHEELYGEGASATLCEDVVGPHLVKLLQADDPPSGEHQALLQLLEELASAPEQWANDGAGVVALEVVRASDESEKPELLDRLIAQAGPAFTETVKRELHFFDKRKVLLSRKPRWAFW